MRFSMRSEMIEAVGHEYYAEWFRCCDDLLAKDGLVVVQVPIHSFSSNTEFSLESTLFAGIASA